MDAIDDTVSIRKIPCQYNCGNPATVEVWAAGAIWSGNLCEACAKVSANRARTALTLKYK